MRKTIQYFSRLFFPIAVLMNAASTSQAETFTLELKKLDDQSFIARDSSKENFLYLLSVGQSFVPGWPGGPPDTDGEKFARLVKKDRDSYESKYPAKGVVTLDKNQFIFALEADNLYAESYNKLYFDRNHNFDLTDDPLLEASDEIIKFDGSEGSAYRQFPRQEITLDIEGTKVEYSFFFSVSSTLRQSNDPPDFVSIGINPAVFREGEFELNGKKHQLALVDFNSNGRFNDGCSVDGKTVSSNNRITMKYGDRLFLDPDKSNKVSGEYLALRKDSFPIAKLIQIDGQFYNLAIAAAGDRVTLTPSDVSTGMVKNPNKRYFALFYGEKGVIKINGEASNEVAMPEGRWKLMDYTIDATEGESSSSRGRSNRTQVSAVGTTQSSEFLVKKGSIVDLPFGPPYKPLVEVQSQNRSSTDTNEVVFLNLLLQGKGNEICRSLTVNGKTPESPSFAIATKTNEIIERGSFEYG